MVSMKKLTKRLDWFSDVFLMVCLGVMAIVLFMQVFFRYVLNTPLIWGEELARYLHVWIALMGIRFGLKYNAHLNIGFFYERFSETTKNVVNILVNVFLIVCIIIYLPGAYRFFINQATILSPAMEVNMGLVHIPVLLGFLGAFIYMVSEVIKNIVSLKERSTKRLSGKGGEQS